MTRMERPTLAAITLNPTGGGIAAVADLLWRVLQDTWGSDARLITMFDHENRTPTAVEKSRFALTLASLQASNQTDWILFAHLALAQIQTAIPLPLRRRHGVFLYGFEAWTPLPARKQDALAAADVRIAISRFTAARALEANPGAGAIEVCPLPLPQFAEPVDETNTAPLTDVGPHAVLIVGRMSRDERYKGHDQLIEAWPAVVARVPDAQLVIAGSGNDQQRLMRKAQSGAAARAIRFTGYVSRPALEQLYRQAALFALPSRGEGFGLVYLEAMAHGLACIGSTHDAAREVILDGETGRLVDQQNIAGLADAITALLADEGLRRRMGAAGRMRLDREFTFQRFSDRVCQLLGATDSAQVAAAG